MRPRFQSIRSTPDRLLRLVVLVSLIQLSGDRLAKRLNKR